MNARTRWKALLAVSALALVAGACGDDDDEAATDTTEEATDTTEEATEDEGEGADSEFCQLAAEFDEQETFPSVEQLEAIDAAAPEEISEEVSLVVDAFREATEAGDPGAAFADPAVEEAVGPIEAYEAEVCGLDRGDDEEADQDPSVTVVDPEAAQVAVTATEYAFDFEPPEGGPTSFTMTNAGEETHVMALFKLVEGATLDDALDSEGSEEFVEEGQEFDSQVAPPGEEAVLTADLTPGTWAMICYIPNAEGTPHFVLGQAEEFTIE